MDDKVFKRRFWTGIGIIIGSIALFAVAIFFIGGDMSTQASAITAARSNYAEQSAMVNDYGSLKADAANAAVYQTAMSRLLSSQNDLIGFSSQIDNVAHNDGVDLTFAFVGAPVLPAGNTPGSAGFKMTAIGSLQNIVTFLHDIELGAPIMLLKIGAFDLTQSGSNYSITATGNVFFQ
jgi:hypothetical protein